MNVFKSIRNILSTVFFVLLNLYTCVYCAYSSIIPLFRFISNNMVGFESIFLDTKGSMLLLYYPTLLFGFISWIILTVIYDQEKRIRIPLKLSILPNAIMFYTFSLEAKYFYGRTYTGYLYWLFILWTVANIALCVYLIVCEIRSLKQQTVKAT